MKEGYYSNIHAEAAKYLSVEDFALVASIFTKRKIEFTESEKKEILPSQEQIEAYIYRAKTKLTEKYFSRGGVCGYQRNHHHHEQIRGIHVEY